MLREHTIRRIREGQRTLPSVSGPKQKDMKVPEDKRCRTCGEWKPDTELFFYQSNGERECKVCCALRRLKNQLTAEAIHKLTHAKDHLNA